MGPEHPYRQERSEVRSAVVEDFAFDAQYNTFSSYGYSHDPTGGPNMVGDARAAYSRGGSQRNPRTPRSGPPEAAPVAEFDFCNG